MTKQGKTNRTTQKRVMGAEKARLRCRSATGMERRRSAIQHIHFLSCMSGERVTEGHEAVETTMGREVQRTGEQEECVDMFAEYARALGDACEGLTGRGMAMELVMLVLVRHRGFRTPSAQVFWMDPGLSTHAWFNLTKARGYITELCACGAGGNIIAMGHPVRKRLAALRNGEHPPMTARAAMHLQPRRPAVPSTYLQCGKHMVWTHEGSSVDCFGAPCRKTLLWNRVLMNRALDCNPTHMACDVTHWSMWRWFTDPWLTEARFLLYADRGQIRELIARAHGTKLVRLEGDDYTSRAEWVRVYYNSLRETPLEDWPRAPTPSSG